MDFYQHLVIDAGYDFIVKLQTKIPYTTPILWFALLYVDMKQKQANTKRQRGPPVSKHIEINTKYCDKKPVKRLLMQYLKPSKRLSSCPQKRPYKRRRKKVTEAGFLFRVVRCK